MGETGLLVIETLKNGNIRKFLKESPEKTFLSIRLQLEHCARTYCGAKNDNVEYNELTDFIITEYPHIGISEITEAFKMAASGKLGEIKMTAYYGTFTGVALGAVMSAYDRYRKTEVLAKLKEMNDQAARKTELTEEEIRAKDAEAIAVRIEWLLAQNQANPFRIYERDFGYLKNAGLIELSMEEYQEIYELAKGRFERQNKLDLLSVNLIERETARYNLKLLESPENPELKAKIQGFARKLAVLNWIEKRQVVEAETI